jgi:hypothetical protein
MPDVNTRTHDTPAVFPYVPANSQRSPKKTSNLGHFVRMTRVLWYSESQLTGVVTEGPWHLLTGVANGQLLGHPQVIHGEDVLEIQFVASLNHETRTPHSQTN